MTGALMNYYQQHQSDFVEGLKAFLRIPSISALSEHKPDIRRAADFALNELRAAGMTSAELIEGDGNPLVYAEWLGAPGKPTILFYGHYDVQPPDPLDEWKSPPFEPEVRGDDIFARGACDDKGQVYIQIKAVEGLLKTTGKLPVNVKFLLEGEEETGGEHIEAYVKTKPPRLKADAVVVCDTEMFAPELPSITIGLRGLVYYELSVQGADHDLHSGIYGGAAPNPIMAIAEILTALKDRDGHILVPGFYDRVVPPAEKERAAWARLPFDEKEYTEKEMGAKELVGEPGVPLFERVWARPTVEGHGIRASIKDIQITLLITIVLVILVIFAFLRDVWATLIPAVAVPVSLIGTFGVMYLLNYSLDNLSLMAITISTGFVVDDAIVVIENITRYQEAGLP